MLYGESLGLLLWVNDHMVNNIIRFPTELQRQRQL